MQTQPLKWRRSSPRDVGKKAWSLRLAVVISAAASGPCLSSSTLQLRQAVFDLSRADLTYSGEESGFHWRHAIVQAHLFPRDGIVQTIPAERKHVVPRSTDMLVFTPVDLESIPLSVLHLVTALGIQGEMPRGLWDAVHAFRQHSDQWVNIRSFSVACPILDAFSMAAELEGDSAESSIMGSHLPREAQGLILGEEQASLEGATKRMRKLVAAAWTQVGGPTVSGSQTCVYHASFPATNDGGSVVTPM